MTLKYLNALPQPI